MTKFTASAEYLTSTRAIVALTDSRGEWAGAYRVDAIKGDLYEACYRAAAQAAHVKGGRLETFRVV